MITVEAVRTVRPDDSEILAVPVLEDKVPASVVVALVLVPLAGVAVRFTVVPTGTFAALITTLNGLVWFAGRTTSGEPWNEPIGFAGTAIPATDTICRDGMFVGIAELGSPELMGLLVLGLKPVRVNASTRI